MKYESPAERILSFLECNVCFSIPNVWDIPDWYVTSPSAKQSFVTCSKNNHILCYSCFKTLSERDSPVYCVLRCGGLCQSSARHLPLINIAQALTKEKLVACCNSLYGCSAEIVSCKLNSHLLQCDFNPTLCPNLICPKIFSFKDLSENPHSHSLNLTDPCFFLTRSLKGTNDTWRYLFPHICLINSDLSFASSLFMPMVLLSNSHGSSPRFSPDHSIKLVAKFQVVDDAFHILLFWMEPRELVQAKYGIEDIQVRVSVGCPSLTDSPETQITRAKQTTPPRTSLLLNLSGFLIYEGPPLYIKDLKLFKQRSHGPRRNCFISHNWIPHYFDRVLVVKQNELFNCLCTKKTCEFCNQLYFFKMVTVHLQLLTPVTTFQKK